MARDNKLGILPGDTMCTIEAYCSFPVDPAEFAKKCEAAGDTLTTDLGIDACVHTTQRGVEQAYTYKVIDRDTKCSYRVLGGPSVTDEMLVQTCTQAALDLISRDSLKKYH
jgi:hypothetical protein